MAGPPGRPDPWSTLRAFTPARIALGAAGGGLPTRACLDFQEAHAAARDAVHEALDFDRLAAVVMAAGAPETVRVRSRAGDRATYLRRPDLGRTLDPQCVAALRERRGAFDLAFVIADGLSARAVERHAAPLLRAVLERLLPAGWRIAPVALAEQGRVALGDACGELLGAALVAVLIGERPGLSAADSLGVYLTFDPRPGRTDAERNCLSNIRPEGLDYPAGAAKLCALAQEARRLRYTGVSLKEPAGPAELAPPPGILPTGPSS